MGWCGVDCIDMTQNRDQWMIRVNTVMNIFGYHKMQGNSSVTERLVARQEALCSMELVKESICKTSFRKSFFSKLSGVHG
jgi:hypothetical protein